MSYNKLRNLRLRLIECSQIPMVKLLLMKERAESGFNASSTVILISKTSMVVEERMFSEMQYWRHYLIKARVKCNKNWQYHWE
ncbi:hypothetical protein EVAR_41246_1 [Eumeta japonica]|uniref:Uncharacterized protein n=1 Tax=Eumeta variegata TaxID=151549 RepID=A0A4C1W6Z4_EUMVA|nr:hypothetical protein EVAR_41246_1 [Eumeta japonica]